MKCIDVQRLILPFINGELSITELEEFLEHIHKCPDCFDELEVYYALISGMRQLDEDKELSNDFHKDLILLIKNSEERIKNHKQLHSRKKVGLIVIIMFVAIASSYRLGGYVVEDVKKKEKESVYQFDELFHLNNGYFNYREDNQLFESRLPKQIRNNMVDIYKYLLEVDKISADKLMEEYNDILWFYGDYPNNYGLLGTDYNETLLH